MGGEGSGDGGTFEDSPVGSRSSGLSSALAVTASLSSGFAVVLVTGCSGSATGGGTVGRT